MAGMEGGGQKFMNNIKGSFQRELTLTFVFKNLLC